MAQLHVYLSGEIVYTYQSCAISVIILFVLHVLGPNPSSGLGLKQWLPLYPYIHIHNSNSQNSKLTNII